MVQEISKYHPLVGPKIGEKNELLYCLANNDINGANFDKIKPKIEKSKSFDISSSIWFFKIS